MKPTPPLITPTAFSPPSALTGFRWPRLPWGMLAAIGTVALTFGVMAYLLLARSVSLTAIPADAQLGVEDFFAPRIGSHWLLVPGPHRITGSAPGYKPLDAEITVTEASLQQHTLALTPLPGRLTVSVEPVGEARVSIDGVEAGKAPGVIEEIEAGTREVLVEAPRYMPFVAKLEVRGKRQDETLAVKLTPAWADFKIASQPAGAQVSVDGKLLGPTPLAAELLHGEHRLSVSRAGYKPWSRTLQVEAGRAVSIPDVVLAKADGMLEIVTEPRGAAITVDGRYRGESPLKVAVTPDTDHRITAMLAGHEPQNASGRAASDATSNIALQLAAELAVINLMTEPADAELLVNGQPAGNATQRLSLPTKEHEIVVRRAGYASFRTLITPRRGVDKHLRISLKTAAEMAASEAPPAYTPPPSYAPPVMPNQQNASPYPEQGSSEAQRQADLSATQFAPPEVQQAMAEQRGREPGSAAAAPPPATAGRLRTGIGQDLARFDGGDFSLPGRATTRLTRPFYLGLREVSNADYRRFIANHVSRGAEGQALDADNQPVVGVSWEAAAVYCNWLSRRDSLPVFYQIRYGRVLGINPDAVGYRLPTEAEWMWAAGVGPDGRPQEFPWGAAFPPTARGANLADGSASQLLAQVLAGFDDGFAGSAPVGSFPPNGKGLFDLAGNVAEWVHDGYTANPAAGLDPLGPPNAAQHVVAGSSWATAAREKLRSGAREAAAAGRPDLGFRLARYAQ